MGSEQNGPFGALINALPDTLPPEPKIMGEEVEELVAKLRAGGNETDWRAADTIESLRASLTRVEGETLRDLATWLDELNTPQVILPDDCPEGEREAARTGFAYAADKIAEEIEARLSRADGT